jgi:hypothetical protein
MNLDHLVTAIQQGALTAANAIQNHNLKLIDIYFEETDGEDVGTSLKEALRSSIKGHEDGKAEALADEVMKSISPDLLDTFKKEKGKLKPKTVTLQYPKITAKGSEIHDVIVPLISLVPITLTEIANVKFKTDLEVQLIDDNLSISFPSKTKTNEEDKHLATLEVSIDKAATPEGLKKLIEGYDKALRAQIPG